MSHTTTRGRFILPLLAAGLLLAACDDPTEVDDHIDVEGIALFEGTTEIYRYMREDGAEPGLTLTEGTREVVFVLLDHDGEPLVEEGHEGGEEHVLEITIGDTGILTWTPEAHTDVHEFVEFHGELDALQPGTTSMLICVPHDLHCDFEADVPVTITAP